MKENKNQSVVVENAGSDDTEIDLVELFYVFLNRIWLLVMCLVIGGAAAFAWTACFIKPVYKTSAELYVVSASNNSVVNLADLQLGSAVKTDYMELMLSRPVLEKVIENLNLNKSVKQLQKMISITNKSDTRILQITTTSTDPQLATDVANELATQAILMLPEIMENEPPNLVCNALYPTAPAGSQHCEKHPAGCHSGLRAVRRGAGHCLPQRQKLQGCRCHAEVLWHDASGSRSLCTA